MKLNRMVALAVVFLCSACSQAKAVYTPVTNSGALVFSVKGMKDCQQHTKARLTYLALCRSSASDSDSDYGWRIVQTRSAKDEAEAIYVSAGFADAYQVQLELRDNGNNQLLLAEASTEYFDGVAVFRLADSTLKDLGYISLAAGTADASVEESLLPILIAVEEGNTLIVRFNGPTTTIDSEGLAHTIPTGQVEYHDRDGRLVEIRR